MAKRIRWSKPRRRRKWKPRKPPSSVKPLAPGQPGHIDKVAAPTGQQLKNQPEARETQPIQALQPGQQPQPQPGQQPQQLVGTPVPPAQQTISDVSGIGTQTVNPALPQPGQQQQQQQQPGQIAGVPQLTNPDTGQPMPQQLMRMGADIGESKARPDRFARVGESKARPDRPAYKPTKSEQNKIARLGKREDALRNMNEGNPNKNQKRMADATREQAGMIKSGHRARYDEQRQKHRDFNQEMTAKYGGKFGPHGFGGKAPKKPPTREQQFKDAMSPNQKPPWTDLAGFNKYRQELHRRSGSRLPLANAISMPSKQQWEFHARQKQKELYFSPEGRRLADKLNIKWEKK